MSRTIFLRVAWTPFLACTLLHAQEGLPLNGFVTFAGTSQAFDVNGAHITCAATTKLRQASRKTTGCRPFIYGEHLIIDGKLDKKTNVILATEIETKSVPSRHKIHGIAVIDKVLSPTLLRADGFAVQITPATETHWDASLTPNPVVDQWIEYEGQRDTNGTIVASYLAFYASNVTPKEQKLRDKNEFDPAAVSEDKKQKAASKLFTGVDYKRIPAVHDAAQQQRIDVIGSRLIPAYQKELAAADPDKINFRLQLVNTKWDYCVTLPNGIILIPAYLAVDLNDDELAAVLAYNIAGALEKQAYRSIPANNAMMATNILGAAAGFVVPGLDVASYAGTGIASSKLETLRQEQKGRISLVLLHDAGFDLHQAPIAWWRVIGNHTSRDSGDFMQNPAPHLTAYLFQAIATTWGPSSPLLATPDGNR